MSWEIALLVCQVAHNFVQDWNILTTILWLTIPFGTDIHDPERMTPIDFDRSLTFPAAPLWFWYFSFLVKSFDNYWMDWHKIMGRYVHVPQRMNRTNFVDPLTFSLSTTSMSNIFTSLVRYLIAFSMYWHKNLYRHPWFSDEVSLTS